MGNLVTLQRSIVGVAADVRTKCLEEEECVKIFFCGLFCQLVNISERSFIALFAIVVILKVSDILRM